MNVTISEFTIYNFSSAKNTYKNIFGTFEHNSYYDTKDF